MAILAMSATAASPADMAHLDSFFNFETRPSKQLSRTEPTPVWMETTSRYGTHDGSHLPAATELRLQADRHLALDLKGVPGCGGAGIRSDVRRSPGEFEDLCPKSIVGRGEISVEVEFPGHPRSKVSGRLVLFKASDSPAGIDLVAHAFFPAPVMADIPVPVDIRRVDKGRIGWEARLSIPKIAGGNGSLSDYSLRIGKPFLSARCVDGKLELRAVTVFAVGSRRSDRAVRTCTVAEADVRQ